MINLNINTKYKIKYTTKFNKNYKKIKKQGKNTEKLKYVIYKLANKIELEEKFNNHILIDSKDYKNCFECHIEPDWLLIYQIIDNELILVLVAIGSHSDLF